MAARKKSRQAVRNRNGGIPGWGYALAAFIVGALLMALVLRGNLLRSMSKDGPKANPQATAQRGSEPGMVDAASSESVAKKPTYDFYSVLPEKDIRIPDAEISALALAEQKQKQAAAAQQQVQAAAASAAVATPTPVTAPPLPAAAPRDGAVSQDVTAAPAAAVPVPAAGSGYLLQVGAFPDPAAAESQKAKLAMQGFVANVQTVNINGQAYHRVRLGPFRSATELEATKQRLAGAGINAIALKEGK
ncbi:MAG: SPOR domain-containing protein [Rhodanobacter sp.]